MSSSDFVKMLHDPLDHFIWGSKFTNHTTQMPPDQEIAWESFEHISLNSFIGGKTYKNLVYARAFLIESDVISATDFYKRMIESKVPYSAVVYTGGKSLHFYVRLDTKDMFPSYDGEDKAYKLRMVTGRVVNILNHFYKCSCDESASTNASVLARIPDGINSNTQKRAVLCEMRGRVNPESLKHWILQHDPNGLLLPRPIIKTNIQRSSVPNPHLLKSWTKELLQNGIHQGKRNVSFHEMAYDFYRCGFDLQQAFDYIKEKSIDIQTSLLTPDGFTESELWTTLHSAYRKLCR